MKPVSPSDAAFWESEDNHIAVNAARPGDAAGLARFATEMGWRSMCLFQTSGSEGLPKWVVLERRSFLISAESVNAHFEVTSADRWLVALPLHHVGGFSIHARGWLSRSDVVGWQPPKWHPGAFVKECARERITLVSLVPAQVHDLVRERLACPEPLRAAIIGGGGMTQALADQAAALGWRVFQSYGMTEAASQIATQPYNPFGAVHEVGSLEVLPHWQLGQDGEGRLILKGEALAKGYVYRNAEGNWRWEPIDPGAGLCTRDLVRLWQHGGRRFLSFVGRESGYVKILGELVHLAPLQARLEELALAGGGLVSLPVIAAVPDERRETRLMLVTEDEHGPAEALRLRFNAATEALCHLERVIQVREIPRAALGKIDQAGLMRVIADV